MVPKIHLNFNCASTRKALGQHSACALILGRAHFILLRISLKSVQKSWVILLTVRQTSSRCHITSFLGVNYLNLIRFKFEPIKIKVKNINEVVKGPTISQEKIPSSLWWIFHSFQGNGTKRAKVLQRHIYKWPGISPGGFRSCPWIGAACLSCWCRHGNNSISLYQRITGGGQTRFVFFLKVLSDECKIKNKIVSFRKKSLFDEKWNYI